METECDSQEKATALNEAINVIEEIPEMLERLVARIQNHPIAKEESKKPLEHISLEGVLNNSPERLFAVKEKTDNFLEEISALLF